MAAVLAIEAGRVVVTIQGALNYPVWPVLRDGREAARAASLPLHIDLKDCSQGDMAGIGEILLAQEHLAGVEFSGCKGIFPFCFKAFGICKRCATCSSCTLYRGEYSAAEVDAYAALVTRTPGSADCAVADHALILA